MSEDTDLMTTCRHFNTPLPAFDKDACQGKDAKWVRQNFPRGCYVCPDCKSGVIVYASFEHYLAGDY